MKEDIWKVLNGYIDLNEVDDSPFGEVDLAVQAIEAKMYMQESVKCKSCGDIMDSTKDFTHGCGQLCFMCS